MTFDFTTRELLTCFFRQSRMFLRILGVVVAFGILTIIFSARLYEAGGSMLVKFEPDAVSEIGKTSDRTQLMLNDRREIMQSNMEIFESNDVLRAVFAEVGVDRVYPGLSSKVEGSDLPVEAAIRRFVRDDLYVRSNPHSNIIDFSVLNKDPQIAAEVAQSLQRTFIARQSDVFNKPQVDFLRGQLEEARSKLDDSQRKMQQFKIQVGVSSLEEELEKLLDQKSDATYIALQAVDDAQTKLAELKDKEAEMLTTYRSDSPAVARVRETIGESLRQLRERQENVKTGAKDTLLTTQLAAIDERIAELESKRGDYDNLARALRSDEENYKHFLARSEEARVTQNLADKRLTRISVVDEPIVPIKPARPRKLMTLCISLLAGLLLGLSAVAICELWDERFRTPEQLARSLGLPVLASFPAAGGA